MQARILVVDDDEAIRDALREILEDDYAVVCVDNGLKAVEMVKKQVFDLVFLDIIMPEIDGIETLRRLKVHDKMLDIIMISAVDRAQEATDSIKLGAYDYITKPFDHEIILNRLKKVLQNRSLIKEISFHRAQAASGSWRDTIVSKSKKMTAVLDLVSKVADTSSSVLITGESGTGKELIAKAVHNASPRHDKPFVAINCAAIPAELMEAELFGHEKGAFTGAHKQTIGKFEFAHQGTIFLDEISSLKSEFQAKLLRFIQEREFARVGNHRTIKVDVRIVAATNTSLDEMVKEGTFRDDLYFRLNVVPVLLPPLRSRKGDVPLLADFFLDRFNRRMNKSVKGFTPDAIIVLEAYPWPGNIRELENLVERMVVLGSENQFIDEKDLPFDLLLHGDPTQGAEKGVRENKGLVQARQSFERLYILRALKNCRWNQTLAASLLGIHRNTLIQKMKSLNLTRNQDDL
ncbi:sigma-54-dependent transcriptional regulator [Desulfobacula toluolica]|uniref:Two component system response regulator, sigma54-specific n=1 Tax=Desulfobacula toluolica (strain DSM 7467 / Tol2) TaxID=651182 RepID=K0N6R0_DESTT|nr:sigma-54 dependent transcriptional regulator [Desulfobacula toluolica]CCK79669.1 two component system response regulator, sigma54-specific [Desulfobacula toluolica Tol2]